MSAEFCPDGFHVSDRLTFSIGQDYTDGAAHELVCDCGCVTFSVGVDSYWTGVKCSSCGREMCVHAG